MSVYKAMYQQLFRETERAINALIQAQRDAEELLLSSDDPEADEGRAPEDA
jgi:hypothetical protein